MSQATLLTLNNNTFPTNGTGTVAASAHRAFNTALINEMYIPVGLVIPFIGTDAEVPAGFLTCNGAQIADSLYPLLVALLGTPPPGTPPGYHVLPNFEGFTIMGKGVSTPLFGMGTINGIAVNYTTSINTVNLNFIIKAV